jgi:cytochrome bd-type quinol oxidase subunit 1
MSAVAKFLHSVVIGLAIGAIFYTAVMSYYNLKLLEKNNEQLTSITSELKLQNTTLKDILKESTKSATVSASPTVSPKE